MRLICFPHYTCGALLCDILNHKTSPVAASRGSIDSVDHSLAKIGDSDSVFDNFDPAKFYDAISKLDLTSNLCIGTHCWPGEIDTSMFTSVICITTMTYRSRVYRWARSFYHYYLNSTPWQLTGIELIDKQRETAKNYLKPFRYVNGAINIEFSEIVNNAGSFKNLIADYKNSVNLTRWQNLNNFLYDSDFWNSVPVQRFHEAELEIELNAPYVYK